MIGLGRMGANMVKRLMEDGHECVVFDLNEDAVSELAEAGATGADSVADLVSKMNSPARVWIMVPAGVTGQTVTELAALMSSGDTIIDGGNSYYKNDVARAGEVGEKGIHYVDVGVSGGVWGLERGYSLMIGGEDGAVESMYPIFESIAPGVGNVDRTPGRTGEATPEEKGYLHCGPNGAGHFVKMVHNGIEYGIMAAFGEGFDVLKNADLDTRPAEVDAETAPRMPGEHLEYKIDTTAVAEVWRRGTVIASWLLDLTAQAMVEDPNLDNFTGRISDSGEGRWTILAAINEGTSVPLLADALFSRFRSRSGNTFGEKVQSAMRYEFGGHHEKKA